MSPSLTKLPFPPFFPHRYVLITWLQYHSIMRHISTTCIQGRRKWAKGRTTVRVGRSGNMLVFTLFFSFIQMTMSHWRFAVDTMSTRACGQRNGGKHWKRLNLLELSSHIFIDIRVFIAYKVDLYRITASKKEQNHSNGNANQHHNDENTLAPKKTIQKKSSFHFCKHSEMRERLFRHHQTTKKQQRKRMLHALTNDRRKKTRDS